MDADEYMQKSYDVLIDEQDRDMEIAEVNPSLFRDLQYMLAISPDVLSPRSDDLMRAFALEDFDRMVMQPTIFDPEETGKMLLNYNPVTKTDPEKYLAKQQAVGMVPPGQLPPNTSPTAKPNGTSGGSPINSMSKKSPQSTGSPQGALAGTV